MFELKTVQVIDGEDLRVSKPCILAEDEGYNCEWSTELTVPQARDEYIKAWVLLHVLARELGLKCTGIGAKVALYYWPSALIREFLAIFLTRRFLLWAGLGYVLFISPVLAVLFWG